MLHLNPVYFAVRSPICRENHVLAYQQLAGRGHRICKARKYLNGIIIRPVVDYVLEKVDIRLFLRLWLKEVVGCKACSTRSGDDGEVLLQILELL